MIISAILLLLSLGLQGLFYYLSGWYLEWYMFWTWIILPFAFFWGLFAIYVIFLFIVNALLGSKEPEKPSKFCQFIVHQTAFICMIFMRVRLRVRGLGKLPKKGVRFMLINNHVSSFDEFAMIHAFRHHDVLYVSKEANFKLPAGGNWIRKAGYLSIIQGDLLSGAETIARGANYIESGKYSVCVAPEGTRNKDFPNPPLLPFHNGTFNLAKQAHCPIVVVAIQNTYAIMKRWPLKSTKVYLDVVGVVDEERVESSTTQELAEYAKGLMLKRFEEKQARFYHLNEKPDEETEAKEN